METNIPEWREPKNSNPDEETDNESNGLSNNESEEPLSPSSDTQTTPPASRPSSPHLACTVCIGHPDVHTSQPPTAQCTHTSTICPLCLEKHISLAVLTNGSTAVPCPEVGCKEILEYSDVIKGAKNDKACLDRYEELLLRRMLQTDPNFVWCKNAACQQGQLHESGDDAPIVICQACQARSCFTHDVPWHTDQTCDEYDAEQAGHTQEAQDKLAKEEQEKLARAALDNLATNDYIREHTKACPSPTCGRNIEKNEGCDHMTCQPPGGCGHEFCWICLADYGPIRSNGNHHHNSNCTYYAAIDPAPQPPVLVDD
ncbi:hypothetical protein BDV93DRAFT_556522 [Ceratobasidium sp. AG-I]|nr:hypothetical protein BDV93DRAFT_556522 [Ceratobasidium sp. AG-I]